MKKYHFIVVLLLLSGALGIILGALNSDSDPLKKVASELAQGMTCVKERRVAILAVPHHDSHSSEGPALVSERLATYLARDKRLTILERHQIDQVLGELHLSETGVLDPKSAKKIGDALGANIIVTGTLIDLNDGKTELNVRSLLSENGRIIAASRATINRSWQRLVVGW